MKPERWQQIEKLYYAARKRDPGGRAAFLDQACAGDEELRREVESLLASDEQAGNFLATPALKVAVEEIAGEQTRSLVGQQLGHYRILSLLGAGGMGEVYLAEDARLGRKVALKLLPAKFLKYVERARRFEKEARAASALNHPNIITIYEIGEAEAGSFIVMEFVQGRTLRSLIDQGITLNSFAQLGGQIAKALSVAHGAGIIHRDIKPENIMVRDDGYVKVLDFGVARLVRTEMDSDAMTLPETMPGALLGTVAYMSPEQARGETAISRTDIFSLGLVFYEMATGQHPFATDATLSTLNAITSQTPTPPSRLNPNLPAALEVLILRMLEKEAQLRPDAAEVSQVLDGLQATWREQETGAMSLAPRLTGSARRSVGRKKELAQLREGFASAAAGKGLLLCVAGEPGIGKTTLVEDFLAELKASGDVCLIARGRCTERLAGTEAYLPWLEALENLLRSEERTSPSQTLKPGDLSVAQVMKRLAPSWYAQVAPLAADDSSAERLLAERAMSQERLKRELSAAVQSFSEQQVLVLFFDDLHWADVSTIDLLAFLAGRFAGLRVLIIATYRLTDMLLVKHSFLQLKPELQARRVCHEIAVEFLNRKEIEEYLALEFPEHRFPNELPALIHAKTEGNPLFMSDLVRYLRDRQVIAKEQDRWTLAQSIPDIERDLPESVRGMIERKIAQLGEEDRRLLVAASVQGYEFDSTVAAKVLGLAPDEVEERLETLERVQAFVKQVEERGLPDGTLTLRYRFVHVLYQNALYASLRSTRKVTLSRNIAQAIEGYYGEYRASVANELAALYEAAREFARAVEYFRLAAQQASQVFATQEAVALAHRGLALIQMLPEMRERSEQELSLQVVLGNALMATRGYGAPEVEQTYSRAQELCRQLSETSHLLPVLYGSYAVHITKARVRKALELGEEFLGQVKHRQDPAIIVGHNTVGIPLFFLGELRRAREHLEQGVSLYDPARHHSLTWLYGNDQGILGRARLAWILWLLGYPEQALKQTHEMLRLGQEVSHANSQAYALFFAALHYQSRREWRPVRELAEALIALAAEQGLALWLAAGKFLRGWTIAEHLRAAEGIDEMRRGMEAYHATGAESLRPYFLCLLVEAYGKAGQIQEGLATLDEAQAVVEKNEERFWEAEIYRLRGELLLDAADISEVEASFHHAIEIARRQQAKSLELRAVISQSRWWRRQGKRAEAHVRLAEIHSWFTEGFDTLDVQEAKVLLDELA